MEYPFISGMDVWTYFVVLRNIIISFVHTAHAVLSFKLSIVLDAIFVNLPSDNVIITTIRDALNTLVISVLGDPTVLDLMFGMFIVYVAVVVVKWFIDLFK